MRIPSPGMKLKAAINREKKKRKIRDQKKSERKRKTGFEARKRGNELKVQKDGANKRRRAIRSGRKIETEFHQKGK